MKKALSLKPVGNFIEHKANETSEIHPILTADQVCLMLSISKPTLIKYTKNGTLKSYKLGVRVFYKQQEVIDSLTPVK